MYAAEADIQKLMKWIYEIRLVTQSSNQKEEHLCINNDYIHPCIFYPDLSIINK